MTSLVLSQLINSATEQWAENCNLFCYSSSGKTLGKLGWDYCLQCNLGILVDFSCSWNMSFLCCQVKSELGLYAIVLKLMNVWEEIICISMAEIKTGTIVSVLKEIFCKNLGFHFSLSWYHFSLSCWQISYVYKAFTVLLL